MFDVLDGFAFEGLRVYVQSKHLYSISLVFKLFCTKCHGECRLQRVICLCPTTSIGEYNYFMLFNTNVTLHLISLSMQLILLI